MAKLTRPALVILAAVGAIFLPLPKERMPFTGQWLIRAGLESRTVKVGRLNVRYVRKGQGPTLILIHGLASSIYTWSEVIGPLTETFDVIALDLPGFGASEQPSDLTFDDYPATVIGLMETLGVAQAHFAGNSMGGAIALLIAARMPERVDHLVILDSAGLKMKRAERPLVVQLLGSKAAGALAEALPVRRWLASATLHHLFHDRKRVTQERIDETAAPLLRPGALASARSLLRSRLDEGFLPDLRLIRAKTLVIWGRFDPWLGESQADIFVAEIRGSRKIVLDTGHMPQEERPAEVARLIEDFLIS